MRDFNQTSALMQAVGSQFPYLSDFPERDKREYQGNKSMNPAHQIPAHQIPTEITGYFVARITFTHSCMQSGALLLDFSRQEFPPT